MTPREIVQIIKEQPTETGIRLLLTLFSDKFTVANSAIDPKPDPRDKTGVPIRPESGRQGFKGPQVRTSSGSTATGMTGRQTLRNIVDNMGSFEVRPGVDPNHPDRHYKVHKNPPIKIEDIRPCERCRTLYVPEIEGGTECRGCGHTLGTEFKSETFKEPGVTIDGREPTQEEFDEATRKMNEDTKRDLQAMRDGTYVPVDRKGVNPDSTHPTFPQSPRPFKGST
jgi:hypothetical protein